MFYTVAETIDEILNPALAVPDSSFRWIGPAPVRGYREAFVWTAYCEKHGRDMEQTVVRFFEEGEHIDTWYPSDRARAERLARDWIGGSTEVTDRLQEVLNG